jgi:hypothetical protein
VSLPIACPSPAPIPAPIAAPVAVPFSCLVAPAHESKVNVSAPTTNIEIIFFIFLSPSQFLNK